MSTRDTVQPVAVVLSFALVLHACTSQKEKPRPEARDRTPAAAAKPPEAVPLKKAGPADAVTLLETRVFGIKIPTGMHPAKGPEQVYRFAGNPPMPQVKYLIEEQITSRQKLREVEGWLYRFAKAKAQDESASEHPLLALRVFRSGSGSVLDIWREEQFAKALPDKTARESSYTFTMLGRPAPRAGADLKLRREQRRESLRETMRIMRKAEQGEPLTKAEQNSEVFY